MKIIKRIIIVKFKLIDEDGRLTHSRALPKSSKYRNPQTHTHTHLVHNLPFNDANDDVNEDYSKINMEIKMKSKKMNKIKKKQGERNARIPTQA